MPSVPLCPGCGSSFKTSNGLLSHLRQTANRTCQEVFKRLLTIGLQGEGTFSAASSGPEDDFEGDFDDSEEDVEMGDSAKDAEPRFEEAFEGFDRDDEEPGPEEAMELDVDMEVHLHIEDDAVENPLADFEGVPDLDSDDEADSEEEYHWCVSRV